MTEATIQWDDGDESTMGCKVRLSSGGASWRVSEMATSPLLVRTQGANILRGPCSSASAVPAAGHLVSGVFNLFLSTQGLENKRLAKGLAETTTLIIATQVDP